MRTFVVITLLSCLLPSVAIGMTSPLLDSGDRAFEARGTPDRAREALKLYTQAVTETHHTDADALWRLAMASYFVGMRLTTDSSAKEAIFAQGRDAGLEAIKLRPHCAECQFWTAINMALYGQEVGIFKMLFSLNEIQEHLRLSLEIDPTYASAGSYRLLGVIQRKLPGILGGSNDRAREYFQKAVQAAPGEPLNYLFLAELLKENLDEPAQAKVVAAQGLAIHDIDPNRLESIEAQASLKKEFP